MPIILPSADEITAMDWRSREKALARARELLRDYAIAERLPRLHSMTEEQKAAARRDRGHRADEWGQRERDTAAALLAAMGEDPLAESRRKALTA